MVGRNGKRRDLGERRERNDRMEDDKGDDIEVTFLPSYTILIFHVPSASLSGLMTAENSPPPVWYCYPEHCFYCSPCLPVLLWADPAKPLPD